MIDPATGQGSRPTLPARGRRLAVGALAAVALVAAACSDGRVDEATSPPRPDADADEAGLGWSTCADLLAAATGLECASLEVPLDPSDPDGDTLELALARDPASGPARDRLGSLVMNPGGPGASGIEFLAGASISLPDELRERFDLVSWDPRGVGESAPVRCLDDAGWDAQVTGDISPDTPQEERRAVEDQAELREGCEREHPDMVRHMSTADVAADLEAIRVALEEDELTYLGFSYGTAIGATYATLHPDRIRAMVLDGAVSPSTDAMETAEEQARSFEDTYERFVEGCDDDEQCPLGPDTAATLDGIRADLEESPLVTRTGRLLTRDLLDIGILTALYDSSLWGTLAGAVADLEGGGANVLLSLVDQQLGREPDGSWDGSSDAQVMVNCADSPERPSVDEALEAGRELAESAPTFGGLLSTAALGCVDWPRAENPVPEWSTEEAPIVVVGTVGDPATPYEWAESLRDVLGGSVLLTWEGEGHTALLDADACITDAVVAALVDLVMPEDGTTCDASDAQPSFEPDGGPAQALAEQLEALGFPTDVIGCVVDRLREEFGDLGLDELLLGGGFGDELDAIVGIAAQCARGG